MIFEKQQDFTEITPRNGCSGCSVGDASGAQANYGAHIFLLDEPTAALDPLSENEIYTQFNEMITDKTAILITHRLSAVQLADRIAVFNNGSLIEYGTHNQLYNNGGMYTEMFDKQAQFYINNNQEKC